MSLYYYVPNKVELLDGMIDIVFGEIEPPSLDVDWKTAMRRRAVSTREALNRHRWAVGQMEGRSTHGPANLRLHNAVLGCLRARRLLAGDDRPRVLGRRTPTSTASRSRRPT